ncbi:MAG: hypothetical protein JXR81_09330 [Candidatus Goldbacteria bacterium]|nr:hypothetical protein [Candidatus Goldiibacteriota bacterium]
MTERALMENRKQYRIVFVLVFALVAVLGGLTAVYFYFEEKRDAYKDIVFKEKHCLRQIKYLIESQIEMATADLMILSEITHMLSPVKSKNKERLEREFLTFAAEKGKYDQIRFIDNNGMEVIRVNYGSGKPYVVPEKDLQNKKGRYYFSDVIGLKIGEVFVSPLDLNIEYKEIEKPLKPMIRFGTPVFDENGEKTGIVLINYFGSLIFEEVRHEHQSNAKLYMLNRDGYWLFGYDDEKAWGFMYDDKMDEVYGKYYPEIWEKLEGVAGEKSVDMLINDSLVIVKKIYPLKRAQISSTGHKEAFSPSLGYLKGNEYFWTIVMQYDKDVLNNAMLSIKRQFYISVFMAFLISFVIAYLVSRHFLANFRIRESRNNLIKVHGELEQFAHILSHDMQEPLRMSILFTQLLKKKYKEQNEEIDGYMNEIVNASMKMRNLLNGLRAYLESGKTEESAVNINNIVDEIRAEMELETGRKDVELYCGMLPVIITSGACVKRVLKELIKNAVNFNDKKTIKIIVEASIRDKKIIISVKDNGPGIDGNYAKKVFELFERLDNKPHESSTGAGLAVCKKTVESLGGRIWFESKRGEGTAFYFTIPVKNN